MYVQNHIWPRNMQNGCIYCCHDIYKTNYIIQYNTQWHGKGALRVANGTSYEEAKENCYLVGQMVQNHEIIPYYKEYIVGDGVVTLTSQRARDFIGQKLSQGRKPTAYTYKVCTGKIHQYISTCKLICKCR